MTEVRKNCSRKLPFGDYEVNMHMTSATKQTPKETKTQVDFTGGFISASFFSDGNQIGSGVLMPDIIDVKTIGTVVIVKFADGTEEKAILNIADTYSLEQGVSICVTKKLLGRNTSFGGSLYNKIIKRAISVKKENELKLANAIAQQKAAIEKAEKDEAKRKAYHAKIAAYKREEAIEIQKEAYIRAMKELKEEKKYEIDEALNELGKLFDKAIEEVEKEAVNKDKDGNIDSSKSDVNA